ncbi:MAG: hypothetical protein NZT92_19180 [Abditibacteriales bacterium]|nr:hypothetical protein [Abditibacteriales bacterium]MDW8367924.1 hypothetical protein [Abditibacteriales bacterium]
MARLRQAPIEYKVCADCGIEYEGAQCPQCRHAFDPQTTRKVTHDRLILVGVNPPIYEREARFRCKKCGNLYAAPQSPLCQESNPQRPTIVWVRTFNQVESLEELQRREWLEGEKDEGGEGAEETEIEGVNDHVEESEEQ